MKDIPERELIPKYYVEDKMSTVEIAKKVGLSPGAVGSILKSRGVELRSPKEALKVKYPEGRYGKDAANWKGGEREIHSGYIYVYCPDHPNVTKAGYVLKHRLKMEEKLGRYLKEGELVHHKNGDKTDNSIENLELMASRSEHVQKHFDAVKEVYRLQKILDEHDIDY